MDRNFTPHEANATLPLVKRIVADILRTGQDLREMGGQRAADERKLRELEREMRQLFAELDGIGCSYKDWGFEMGLVDFPAEIEGEEVLLCWRSDEPSVGWFHAPQAGYAGRRPIPQEMLGEPE